MTALKDIPTAPGYQIDIAGTVYRKVGAVTRTVPQDENGFCRLVKVEGNRPSSFRANIRELHAVAFPLAPNFRTIAEAAAEVLKAARAQNSGTGAPA